jgi:hypothetical protein
VIAFILPLTAPAETARQPRPDSSDSPGSSGRLKVFSAGLGGYLLWLGSRAAVAGFFSGWAFFLWDSLPFRGSVAGQLTRYSLKDLEGRDVNVGRFLLIFHAYLTAYAETM